VDRDEQQFCVMEVGYDWRGLMALFFVIGKMEKLYFTG
jgi:hypothetical protein